MTAEDKNRQVPKTLREQAQERIAAAAESIHHEPEKAVKQIEELRIHQVELEIQNEELRTTQQQLLESRENYRNLFEFAPVPYLTLDHDNRITEANQAAGEFFGRPKLIDTTITRFIEEQSQLEFYGCCATANQSQRRTSCELLIRHDSTPKTVLMTVAVFTTGTDEKRYRIMLSDITRQKENEQAISRSREYVTGIVETVRNPLVVLAKDAFMIESVNRAFYEMFTVSAEETIGCAFPEFQDGLFSGELLIRSLTHALRDGEELVNFDYECYLPHAGFRHLLISARRIGTSDLMREKILLFIDDITERKANERKIQELNESLQHRSNELSVANDELESFIYSVSHDLRAPLRTVSGFAEMFQEDCPTALDECGREYLDRIVKGTSKMGNLIDDLLRLTRVSRQELRITNIDMSDLTRKILKEIKIADPLRKTEFHIQNGVIVRADEALLRIVLENLFRNSWKYTSKNDITEIEFGITEVQGRRTCFVRDNGVGFRQELAEKMFNPFQRLHSDTDFPGTGIGLAIVKRIIERHGGVVWAKGEPEKGATVFFSLPV